MSLSYTNIVGTHTETFAHMYQVLLNSTQTQESAWIAVDRVYNPSTFELALAIDH